MTPMVRSPMTTELALLGFLNEQPMHGYEIHRRMSDPSGLGQVWRIKQSQLYALLNKMESAGYIQSELEPQESKPPRKVYYLSDSGKKTYIEWVNQPVNTGRRMRLEFLVKIYFNLRQDDNSAFELLQKQEAVCDKWMQDQEQKSKTLSDQDPFSELICQYRIGQINAMQHWLGLCKKSIIKIK